MKGEEEKLIKKAQQGESESFGLLYDQYFSAIYRFVFLKVSNQTDAEDLTQQVFLKAWKNIGSYKSQGFPFSSWLYKIAHNTVIDHYRTQKIHVDLETVVDQAIANWSNEDRTNEMLNLEIVQVSIKKLESEQQTVLIMKFTNELSNKEIAHTLNKSEGAVRVIQHRALKKLKGLLSNLKSEGQTKFD